MKALVEVFSACLLLLVLMREDFAYPTDENTVSDSESASYPIPGITNLQDMDIPHQNFISKPKSCFHFYVSRNMSSLLSDATKMLQQVHDRHEREWILTFIFRIKSLAEHLRTHPESRNYDCLTNQEDDARRRSMIPQQELYFVDDMLPNTNQKRTDKSLDRVQSGEEVDHQKIQDNQEPQPSATEIEQSASNVPSEENKSQEPDLKSTKPEQEMQTISEAVSKPSSEGSGIHSVPPLTNSLAGDGFVLSSPPDCEANRACERALNRQIAEGILSTDGTAVGQDNDQLVQQVHMVQHEQLAEDEQRQQRLLKLRIRKALLEEMAPEVKKLRTVGGTEEDLISLWRQAEVETGTSTLSENAHSTSDFDYEEIGAAAGDLSSNDRSTTTDHTVAPSLGDMKNLKRQAGSEEATKSYQPYDESDVLVQQLFDVKFEKDASKSANSVSKDAEDIITSTVVPY